MNSRTKFFAILTILTIASVISTKQASAQYASVSFQVFYDQLSPYGQWVDDVNYGYIWLPDAGPDFVPYSSAGHWVFTDFGWTWVSDYDWGWAPFHYGRWDYDEYYGWFWVPGNEWGPAWVVWRRSDHYYGWSPMRPGISLDIAYGQEYRVPADRWVFVEDRYIENPHIYRYYADRGNNVTIINNTTVINRRYEDQTRRTTYVVGPERGEVQRATGRTVRTVSIRNTDSPGERMRRGELSVYRPEVRRNSERDSRPAPSRFVRSDEVKRSPNNSVRRRNDNAPQENHRVDQQSQPQNNTPANDKVRQTRTVPANNTNHNDQPQTQQRNDNPSNNRPDQHTNTPDNSGRDRQKYTGNPAPNNNHTDQQPVQQQNTVPAVNNNRRDQPVHTETPQNNRVEPQQHNANPPVNTRREPTVTPQNNNNRTIQPQQQTQQQPQRTATPAERRSEKKAEAKKSKDDQKDKPAENKRRE